MHGIPALLAGKGCFLLKGSCVRLFTTNARLYSTHINTKEVILKYFSFNRLKINHESKLRFSTGTENDAKISPKQAEELEAKHMLENMLTEEESKKLEMIRLEIDILEVNGSMVPAEIKNWMWLELLRDAQSAGARRRRCFHWHKTETIRKMKEDQKKKMSTVKLENQDDSYNKILLPGYSRFMKHNLAFSLMNGPHLVFDMDYSMKRRERLRLMRHIMSAHALNKLEREPFHFHFCNISPSSDVSQSIDRNSPELRSMLYTITEQSYLDCYPPESLVYLSPDADDVLEEFSYDDVYIIGGLVETYTPERHSYAKAHKQAIRSARIPFEKYVKYVFISCLKFTQSSIIH